MQLQINNKSQLPKNSAGFWTFSYIIDTPYNYIESQTKLEAFRHFPQLLSNIQTGEAGKWTAYANIQSCKWQCLSILPIKKKSISFPLQTTSLNFSPSFKNHLPEVLLRHANKDEVLSSKQSTIQSNINY